MEVNYLKGEIHVNFVKNQIKHTMAKLKRHMVALTYAMEPREELFENMIAPKDGDLYRSVVQKIYTAPKAFERINDWKELYQKH